MRRACFVLMLGLLWLNVSAACSCEPLRTPSVEYQQSDVVFVGMVVDMQIDTTTSYIPGYIVTFNVTGRWKGATGSQAMVWTAFDGTSCGYPFELNGSYLVYGNAWDSTLASTGSCNRTCGIQAAGEDLEYLNSLTSAPLPIEPSGIQSYSISGYPNPSNPTVTLRFSIPTASMVAVALYSITGELIEILYDGYSIAGVSELKVHTDRFTSGIYVAQITSKHGIALTKLLIVK